MRTLSGLLLFFSILVLPGGTTTAREVVIRFEAKLRGTSGTAPSKSITAQAATLSRISGTFGFSTEGKRIAGAGIPGRVSYASYATGFITINELDITGLPGSVTLRVGDGVIQEQDPKSTMPDDLILSYDHVSTDKPIDSLSLRLSYKDAEALQDVSIPSSLNFDDFESASLVFSNRIDQLSYRSREPSDTPSGAPAVPGMTVFEIETFGRID